MGYIPRGEEHNPMKFVSAPSKSDFEAVELSGPEAAAVIHHISDPLVKVLVILIAVTGMRISEALALTWDAINWIKAKIHIRLQVERQRIRLPEIPHEPQARRNDQGTRDRTGGVAAGSHVR